MLLEWSLPEGWSLIVQQEPHSGHFHVLLLDASETIRHEASYAERGEALIVARAAAHVLRTRGVLA